MSILASLFKDIVSQKKRTGNSAPETGRSPQSYFDEGIKILQSGDISGAQENHTAFVDAFPGHELAADLQAKIHIATLRERFPGPDYFEWLRWFHANLKPASYVEIGVENGRSLQYARPPTRAIGIDPSIQIVYTQETWVKLFKLPSDDFFQLHKLPEVLGTENVDLAFVDGLHTFDQALKDFINIERFSSPSTVVLFHDIFPVVPVTAQRERDSIIWLGDTWKAIAMLTKYRPDLKVFTIPTFPSGLTVVTNLDRNNDRLSRDSARIYHEAMSLQLEACMPAIDSHLHVVANDFNTMKQLLEIDRR